MNEAFAQPWWVNSLGAIPVVVILGWWKQGIQLRWRVLVIVSLFAVAFGFVEAAVVVYLRAAVGLLPGYMGTLSDIRRAAAGYQQAKSIQAFPSSLLTIEICREGATILMLGSVAWLCASRARQKWACFLWAFAIWDLTYYASLRITVGWPQSLTVKDVLFLIPVPWISQVWFPIAVSSLTILAIVAVNRRESGIEESRAEKSVITKEVKTLGADTTLESSGAGYFRQSP